MVDQSPTLRRVGLFVFSISIILGVILALIRAIPDLEATMYGFINYGYPHLSSLKCPVLMTTLDQDTVSIRLRNSQGQNLAWFVQSQISSPVLIISSSQRLNLQPNETRVISWPIGKENIAPGNFVLADIYTSTPGPEAMREGTCGTYVLNLPIKGGPVIFYVALFIAVVGVGFGLWLSNRHFIKSDPAVISFIWWMRIITLFVGIGIIAGLLNAWFLALVLVFITLLATAVLMVPGRV